MSSNLFEADTEALEFIELLFFAYQDFTGDPDIILKEFDFGRAHHRIVHFVSRNPGMSVAELLDILRITKQSLARVLKQLIEAGYILQEQGKTDRRKRHLYTTEKGKALHARLLEPQSHRIRSAINELSSLERQAAMRFLLKIVDEEKCRHFENLRQNLES